MWVCKFVGRIYILTTVGPFQSCRVYQNGNSFEIVSRVGLRFQQIDGDIYIFWLDLHTQQNPTQSFINICKKNRKK